MIPIPSREALEGMRRVDIQRLCADYGMRANLSTANMIDLLLDASKSNQPSLHNSVSTLSKQSSGTEKPWANNLSLTTTTTTLNSPPVKDKRSDLVATSTKNISGRKDMAERSSTPPFSIMQLRKAGRQASIVPKKQRGTKEMSEDQRRIDLEEDIYTINLKPASVQCAMCLREIRLDNRVKYQSFNWKGHRRSCKKIKAAEEGKMPEVPGHQCFFGPSATRGSEGGSQLQLRSQSPFDANWVDRPGQQQVNERHVRAEDTALEPLNTAVEEQRSTSPGPRQSATSVHHLLPIAPRRQSEFMLFRVEVLADLKARYPDMPWAERVERVSKQWAAMSQEDKAVYRQRTLDAWTADYANYNALLAADAQGTSQSPPTEPSSSQTSHSLPDQNNASQSHHAIGDIYMNIDGMSTNPSPAGQVTSSASCVQQNPTIISMDPAADVGNTTTNIHWTQTTQTINPMDLFNTSTDPINDMTVTGDTTCNPEWTSGMTQTDGTMENINCMVMSTTPTWNQMEVSLGHFVTIVCWFWPRTDPLRLYVEVPTFPLFTLSGVTAIMSVLNLMPNSSIELYDQSTSRWVLWRLETVLFVESEQRLLYKVRMSPLEGFNDSECVGLQNEVAWLSPGGPTPSEDGFGRSSPSTGSEAVGRLGLASAEYVDSSDDIYQYLSLPDDLPESTPPPVRATLDTNAHPVIPVQQAISEHISTPTPDADASTSTSIPAGPVCRKVDNMRDNPDRELTLTWNNENIYTTDVCDNRKGKGESIPEFVSWIPQFFPLRPHPPLRRWPIDFTVSEVMRGFRRMRRYEALFRHDIRREAFQHVFRCKFVFRDFRRVVNTLENANVSLRTRFEDDENAMWGEFEQAVEVQEVEELPPEAKPSSYHATHHPPVVLSAMTRFLIPRPILAKPGPNMAYYRDY